MPHAHRAGLPPVYNQYTRATERASRIDEQAHAVLRPLFTTSFLIDDWLAAEDCFGAATVVIGSASSKTALALAESLLARGGVTIVGLTSPRNLAFVEGLGLLRPGRGLRRDRARSTRRCPPCSSTWAATERCAPQVHRTSRRSLRHSCSVGATHWEQLGADGRPAPRSAATLFFAPDHVQRRVAEWGERRVRRARGLAWDRFAASARTWLTDRRAPGPDCRRSCLPRRRRRQGRAE